MALVLKFFVIEAYQIPTGSMQPTILGDAQSGIRDRVLADKLCTMIRDPHRWEVMIFRFPLDERRLYVKRIVGLPGETLEIRGGDVWIDGKIARKPDHVNDSVLKAVFPVTDGGMDLPRAFASTGPGVTIASASARFAPDSEGELRVRGNVLADWLHGYDPDWKIPPGQSGTEAVGDLELSCDATLDAGARDLQFTLTNDEGATIFTLPAAGDGRTAGIVFRAGKDGEPRTLWPPARGGAPSLAGTLTPGKPVHVIARNVDREVTLWVGGELVARIDDDTSGFRAEMPQKALASLGIHGGGSVDHVVLRRDIYYTPRVQDPVWHIPADSYFGLGDNTQGSLDGRGWEVKTFTMRDGKTYSGFNFPPPSRGPAPVDANPRPVDGNQLIFADVHGDEFTLNRADIVATHTEFAPFINRRYMLGKATAVFWPIIHPFRWKLIR
jgi:signal peptidase I